jgi:hypothetical protein
MQSAYGPRVQTQTASTRNDISHARVSRLQAAWTTARALCLLVGCLGITGGCAESRVSLGRGARAYVAADYPDVLTRWTRQRSLITVESLDDVLTVAATYESWDFRWAYVVRYAQDYRLTVDQRRILLEKSLEETRDSHLFFVALYGSYTRWTDLTKPSSGWVVRLIDDQGNETAPASIELVTRPSAIERRYFPYTTPWRQVFRIKFPRTLSDNSTPTVSANAAFVGLRFAGAEGNQELRWDLDNSRAAEAAPTN